MEADILLQWGETVLTANRSTAALQSVKSKGDQNMKFALITFRYSVDTHIGDTASRNARGIARDSFMSFACETELSLSVLGECTESALRRH